ncbi:hypothetical protein ACROYT_G007255 [Oculina patagonica]
MIPQQQCLACNALMTSSSRSCECGHVLEDASRYIDGRRFTEYRAKMYSRLDNKRIKRKVQENGNRKNNQPRSINKLKNQPTERNSPRFKPKRQAKHENRGRSSKGSSRINLSSTSTVQPAVQQQGTKCVQVPSELQSRFPNALQEINRRIIGQNFMWLLLS